MTDQKVALFLPGGGARSAYQAGVLKGIAEITRENDISKPFSIISGVSAGSINAGVLAANCQDFSADTHALVYLWRNIKTENIVKVSSWALVKMALAWLARTGAPWRDLPGIFGKWNSIFKRFRRFVKRGIFDAMRMLAHKNKHSHAIYTMLDSTIVRAHQLSDA